MAGRPTSLTPEVQAKIVETIRDGNYRHIAAQAAGVHRNSLIAWEKRGEAGEEPYASFLCELQKAEADAEITLLQTVKSGGDGWQSKAWMLERRFASRWCARVRQHVAEELGAFTDKLRKTLDEPTYRKVVDATREDAPAGDAGSAH